MVLCMTFRIVLLSIEIKVLPVSVVILVANMLLLFIQILFVVVNRSTKHEEISSKQAYKQIDIKCGMM
jgi:Na+-transporting methylmalonyl-CoA/oxaloacetate decarboxylase gamma subunit